MDVTNAYDPSNPEKNAVLLSGEFIILSEASLNDFAIYNILGR
ncbi:MAG TPA: hypothetical protein PLP33_24890 [Leptospiraceae bacterium]|nr:hypothetical protein [Leptospiraceae bacterium]